MTATRPSIAIIIPARFASTRFPGKPLALIAGRPMIRHVWERCRASRLADRVLVATDDERIADCVRAFGGEAVLTPASCTSGTERIARAAGDLDAEIIVNVQGDEPLLPASTIDATLEPMLERRSIDIATAACPVDDAAEFANPNVVKVARAADGRALYFSRAPIPFHRDPGGSPTRPFLRHVGIYAFRRDALRRYAALPPCDLERIEMLEQLRALDAGMRIHVAVVAAATPAVDVPSDIAKVEAALR